MLRITLVPLALAIFLGACGKTEPAAPATAQQTLLISPEDLVTVDTIATKWKMALLAG